MHPLFSMTCQTTGRLAQTGPCGRTNRCPYSALPNNQLPGAGKPASLEQCH